MDTLHRNIVRTLNLTSRVSTGTLNNIGNSYKYGYKEP